MRYRFRCGVCVAKKTIENFVERAIRLYEQEPGEAWVVRSALGQVGSGRGDTEAGGGEVYTGVVHAPRRLPAGRVMRYSVFRAITPLPLET